MRANSLLLACFLVLFWASIGSPTVLAAEKNSADALLLEAFRAERAGGDSVEVAQKFEAVLKADPDNQYALIKLGSMKMNEGKSVSSVKTQDLEAVEYFIRAALANPSSPEAYLYLAQLYYRIGDIIRGDRYLAMSKNLNQRNIYDRVCLSGWRYEDTGNYFGAALTYAPAVFSPDSQFRGNPFLMKRLYVSTLVSAPPYDWAVPVTKLLFRYKTQSNVDKLVDEAVSKLKAKVSEALLSQRSVALAYSADFIVNMILRDLVVEELRKQVNLTDQIPDRHELPTVMYKVFFCNPDDIPKPRFSDPYEAFVKASAGTPQDHQRILSELQDLREKALAATAKAPNDEERAKQLFVWLKQNALKDYHLLDGVSAKGVVEDKKFLCLSGSILYTLIARDAKLDVKGFLAPPNHAYAVLDTDRRIKIETTAQGPEGFDEKVGASKSTGELDRGLFQPAFASYGEVSDPMKLVAQQFRNTTITGIYTLVLNKYEPLFRQVLKSKFGLDDFAQTEAIEQWRRYGYASFRGESGSVRIDAASPAFSELIDNMAVKDENFRKDLIKQCDQNIEMMKLARGLSPFDRGLREAADLWTWRGAWYEFVVPATAVDEREGKRRMASLQKKKIAESAAAVALVGTGTSPEAVTTVGDSGGIDKGLDLLDQEEQQRWTTERPYWMKGLKRLSAAVKQDPCSETLQERLELFYKKARDLAERRQDMATMDELNTYATGLRPRGEVE